METDPEFINKAFSTAYQWACLSKAKIETFNIKVKVEFLHMDIDNNLNFMSFKFGLIDQKSNALKIQDSNFKYLENIISNTYANIIKVCVPLIPAYPSFVKFDTDDCC
jgi:hypothetical protein